MREPEIDVSWKAFGRSLTRGLIGTIAVSIKIAVICIMIGFPVKWCWNYVLPAVSNGAVAEIGFWQALVLTILCSLLFQPQFSKSKG